MRTTVFSFFPAFTRHFEGYLLHPYLDVEGYETVGAGNLIDPVSAALPLPWKISGVLATQAQIRADWLACKRLPSGVHYAAGYYESATSIRLDPADVDALVDQRLTLNDHDLEARLTPGRWEELPARAQLALLSWAWACGPEEHAPHLFAALETGDWARAADEVHLEDSHNPGLVPRNAANRALLLACVTHEDDLDGLSYELPTP